MMSYIVTILSSPTHYVFIAELSGINLPPTLPTTATLTPLAPPTGSGNPFPDPITGPINIPIPTSIIQPYSSSGHLSTSPSTHHYMTTTEPSKILSVTSSSVYRGQDSDSSNNVLTTTLISIRLRPTPDHSIVNGIPETTPTQSLDSMPTPPHIDLPTDGLGVSCISYIALCIA